MGFVRSGRGPCGSILQLGNPIEQLGVRGPSREERAIHLQSLIHQALLDVHIGHGLRYHRLGMLDGRGLRLFGRRGGGVG